MLEGILFGRFLSPHFIAASRLGLETNLPRCHAGIRLQVCSEHSFRAPESSGTNAAFSEPRPLLLYHPVKEQVGVDFSSGQGSRRWLRVSPLFCRWPWHLGSALTGSLIVRQTSDIACVHSSNHTCENDPRCPWGLFHLSGEHRKRGLQGPWRKKQGSSSTASYKPLSQECSVRHSREGTCPRQHFHIRSLRELCGAEFKVRTSTAHYLFLSPLSLGEDRQWITCTVNHMELPGEALQSSLWPSEISDNAEKIQRTPKRWIRGERYMANPLITNTNQIFKLRHAFNKDCLK